MRGAIEVGIDTRLSDGIQRTLLRRARRPRESIAPVPKNQALRKKPPGFPAAFLKVMMPIDEVGWV
jgi:hypothetical protein